MCPHMCCVLSCKRASKSILIAKTVRVAWEAVKRDQVTVAAWPACSTYIHMYVSVCAMLHMQIDTVADLWTCHRKTRELLRSSCCCPLRLVWPPETWQLCTFAPTTNTAYLSKVMRLFTALFSVFFFSFFLCSAAWSQSCLLDSLEMHYGNFVAFSLPANCPLLLVCLISHMSMACAVLVLICLRLTRECRKYLQVLYVYFRDSYWGEALKLGGARLGKIKKGLDIVWAATMTVLG